MSPDLYYGGMWFARACNTDCTDWGFHGLPQSLRQEQRYYLQSGHKFSVSHTNSFPTLNQITPLYIRELPVAPINKQKNSYFCFNLEYNETQGSPEVSVD